MMLKHSLAFAITLSSASGFAMNPARAELTPAQFQALQRTLNEAERLKPLCTRALELGVKPELVNLCEEYFSDPPGVVKKENAQLAQVATDAAAGFASAESKAIEAAQELISGDVESGETKLGQAVAIAEEATEAAKEPASTPDHGQTSLMNDDDNKHRYGGIEFGIGIGFTYDLGNNDRLGDDVILVGANRIVRAQTEGNLLARFMLETHYFFTPCTWRIFNVRNNCRYEVDRSGLSRFVADGEQNFGIGPFVSLQPGSENLIDGVGAGLMIGMRRPGSNKTDSFNIGLGVFYDLRTRILGEGIIIDQPLPPEETGIRFRTTSQSGLLILSSYSF